MGCIEVLHSGQELSSTKELIKKDISYELFMESKLHEEELSQTWILYKEKENYKEYYSKENPSFHRADWIDDKGRSCSSSWKESTFLPGYQEWSDQIKQDDYDNGHIDLGDDK